MFGHYINDFVLIHFERSAE